MRVWTVQPPEVYEAVMRDGVCVSNPKKSSLLQGEEGNLDYQFLTAYSWMIAEMDRRIKRPIDCEVVCPWWGYYRLDGRENLSLVEVDFRDTPGATMVAMELEVPNNEVVLSDLDLWHYVLGNSWIDGSLTEEEYKKRLEWFHALPKEEAVQEKLESWQRIFDLTMIDTDWCTYGFDIQATFWVLRKENIITAQEFIVREIGEVV